MQDLKWIIYIWNLRPHKIPARRDVSLLLYFSHYTGHHYRMGDPYFSFVTALLCLGGLSWAAKRKPYALIDRKISKAIWKVKGLQNIMQSFAWEINTRCLAILIVFSRFSVLLGKWPKCP
jgi:hypothetical protein